jgi:hypothetical protein
VRFRARQYLVDGEQPVEAACLDPPLLLDQLALDHRDLRDRPTPGKTAEAKELHE